MRLKKHMEDCLPGFDSHSNGPTEIPLFPSAPSKALGFSQSQKSFLIPLAACLIRCVFSTRAKRT